MFAISVSVAVGGGRRVGRRGLDVDDVEGFIRTCYAIYHGGGNGYLAIPHSEFQKMIEQSDFLKDVSFSINGKGVMGILDVEESQLVLF